MISKKFEQISCPKCGNPLEMARFRCDWQFGMIQLIGGCAVCEKRCIINIGNLEDKMAKKLSADEIEKWNLNSNSIILTDSEYKSYTIAEAMKGIDKIKKKK